MAEFDLLLRGGTVVTADETVVADVLILEGKIVEVGNGRDWTAKEVVDVSGLHILPGVIDTQVHFREPGLTHKETIESGSRAAAAGGVTTFFEMPNTQPPTTDPDRLREKVEIGERTSWVDFGFFVGATEENASRLSEYEQLPGTPGIKVFVGSSTGSLLVDDREVLREVMKHGERPMPLHCEDETRLRERKSLISDQPHAREHPFLRDAEAAVIATRKVIELSQETGRHCHVLHVSTKDELPLLRAAKDQKLRITCEVTPQHLTFSADDYESLGTKLQMNPPVRSEDHRLALWKAVKDGLFDVFGSDHAPHTQEEKDQEFPKSPSGMPGVQTMLPCLLNWVNRGQLDLNQLVAMSSRNPARLYGIANKGEIAKGFDADLAIVDIDKTFAVEKSWLQSKCGWSPFEGRDLNGFPVHTLVRGKFVLRNGELQEMAGHGTAVTYTWK